MAGYRSKRVGDVLLFLWVAQPTVADMRALDLLVDRTARELGRRMHLVMAVGEHIPLPDSDARQYGTESARRALEASCAHIYTVILGDSFRTSVVRTLLRTMQILMGANRERTSTHASFSEVALAVSRATGCAAEPLERAGRELLEAR